MLWLLAIVLKLAASSQPIRRPDPQFFHIFCANLEFPDFGTGFDKVTRPVLYLRSFSVPMKKIVAYILPVEDETSAELDELPADPNCASRLKVEALLSDGDAEKILATIAAFHVPTSDRMLVTHLIERELALAGPHAQNLWQRIVAGVERKLISQVYADCDGVKTRAAARLGIDRNTLHKKLRQYDLIEDDGEPEEGGAM